MENFGKFMTIVLAMIISSIINGFVIMKLWAWFVVPTFEANPLRLVEAIGIMYLIKFIKMKRDKTNNENFWENFWEEFIANVVFVLLMAGFFLLSGWIVQMFM